MGLYSFLSIFKIVCLKSFSNLLRDLQNKITVQPRQESVKFKFVKGFFHRCLILIRFKHFTY
jgi:hypothetical protein